MQILLYNTRPLSFNYNVNKEKYCQHFTNTKSVNVLHNLNKFPSVSVYRSDCNATIPTYSLTFNNTNSLTITFENLETGCIYLQ